MTSTPRSDAAITADAIAAASARRLADTPRFVPAPRAPRTDIVRSHRHSVRHRSIR